MKRIYLLLYLFCLITAISVSNISCDQPGQNIADINEIKLKLSAGNSFEVENPFIIREFKPFLNGEWIGNAVSYGCYRKGQEPDVKGPGDDEILEDLNIIKQYWNLIRVYNADNETERILGLIKKHDLPIKIMVGVWLANEENHPEKKTINIKNTLRAIKLANEYANMIVAVNVGNETQVDWSAHRMNTDNLIRYIRTVRKNVTVPLTVADDYNFWNKPESKRVAAEVDFIVTHIHPLWNGKTLETAFSWLDSTFKQLQKDHPERLLVLGEVGWATSHNPDKKGPGEQGALMKGEVSVKAQEKYLELHNQWVNKNKITTFLFEAFDEPWKGGGVSSGPNEVEKHWGVFYENRTPKESFQNYQKSLN